jgi:hypothetical protein
MKAQLGALVVAVLALYLVPVQSTCQGNACVEQAKEARSAGLLGSAANCMGRTYPTSGSLPPVRSLQKRSESLNSFDWHRSTSPSCPFPWSSSLQLTLGARILDIIWADGVDGARNDKVTVSGVVQLARHHAPRGRHPQERHWHADLVL